MGEQSQAAHMGLIQQIEGNIVSKLVNSSGTLGSVVREATTTALSLALPNDIEAYSITLQLVKGSNRDSSIQSFTFPVMPESLMMAQRYLMTVTTTLGVTMWTILDVPLPLSSFPALLARKCEQVG
jgi:hypothetical protein